MFRNKKSFARRKHFTLLKPRGSQTTWLSIVEVGGTMQQHGSRGEFFKTNFRACRKIGAYKKICA
jgi:hypothetical protein